MGTGNTRKTNKKFSCTRGRILFVVESRWRHEGVGEGTEVRRFRPNEEGRGVAAFQRPWRTCVHACVSVCKSV